MANFILQLPLITEKYQEDILEKRFRICTHLYNSLLNVTQKRYKEMIKTKKYRNLKESLTGDKKKDKKIWAEINALRKQYGLTEYSFHKDIVKLRKPFEKNIDSRTAQKVATQLWNAYNSFFFQSGRAVHYKKELFSMEGKENTAGMRFIDNTLRWNKLVIPVKINKKSDYIKQALQNKICYCRIVKKNIRCKTKYYLQLVLQGVPPKKHTIGTGDVGIDIGVSTVAISSKRDVKILELANKTQDIQDEITKLSRKMDRSLKATNPNLYDSKGSYIKQTSKVAFNKSNHYIKYKKQLEELYRKQREIRKQQHECLANYIISLGDNIYVEEMNFTGLQKRAKKTEKNQQGRFKCKKRFGKTLANRAPALLLTIIDRKLSYYGKKLIKINTIQAKASQYNHFDNTYNKKPLSQRWNDFNGIKVQRDMYSAFLIMNINSDLKSFNLEKCNKNFDNFKKLHDKEVKRLKGHKNLSCIAI